MNLQQTFEPEQKFTALVDQPFCINDTVLKFEKTFASGEPILCRLDFNSWLHMGNVDGFTEKSFRVYSFAFGKMVEVWYTFDEVTNGIETFKKCQI